MTTKTLYKVIGFGTNEHGFFNQFSCSSSIGYASGFYTAHLQDPEMDGAVIIKCEHEDWEVIQEFNSESYPYSVECGPLFTHKVTKSPDLVMV
jgi:hypothetical protein